MKASTAVRAVRICALLLGLGLGLWWGPYIEKASHGWGTIIGWCLTGISALGILIFVAKAKKAAEKKDVGSIR